jgi:multidrug efflux system membrane fusion protein
VNEPNGRRSRPDAAVPGFRGRRAAAFLSLSALVVVVLAGCQQKAPAAPPQRPPPTVSAALVTVRDVPVYLDEIARCASPEIVSIQAQVSGLIVGVHFKDGAELKKGDQLFTIDPRPFQAQLDQAKAALELQKASLEQSEATCGQQKAAFDQAQAELAQSKSKLDLALLEFERAKNLLETNAVSKQEFEGKQVAVTVCEAQVKAGVAAIAVVEAQTKASVAALSMVKARIGESEAAIRAAEIQLGYTTIVSPLDGKAGQLLIHAGNVVMANAGAPLVVIQRLDPIYVDFSVPERDFARVRASMDKAPLKVECRVPEDRANVHLGDVVFVDNAVQDATGTVKLRATVENKDRYFWPGQFVEARLLLYTQKDAILIPATAAQVGQNGPFVYVVGGDSKASLRPVKLGQRHDALVSIEEGLAAGDKVIVAGQLMVFPGAQVVVESGAEKSEAAGAAPGGPAPAGKDGGAR